MKEKTMKRVLSSAVVLSLTLAGSAWGHPREARERKDPLAGAGRIEWVVRMFEESPSFTVVKREVKQNRVTWVLENRRNLGTEITFGYQAALYDEDGVKLASIGIEAEPFLL